MPALKGWAKDPDFRSNAQKIIDYWRSAAAPDLALMGQRQELRDGPGVTIYRRDLRRRNPPPAGGGSAWTYATIFGLIELAILYALIHFWRRRRRRKTAALAQPTALPEPGLATASRHAPSHPHGQPRAPQPPRRSHNTRPNCVSAS